MENSIEIELKPNAFKLLSNNQINTHNLDVVINHNLSISNSHSYDDIDFVLAREFSGIIREENVIKMLTTNIIETYKKCKRDYSYKEIMKPKRELTIPNEGIYNDGLDNKDNDLIVYVNDIISSPENKYSIIDIIGQGISGQVFKCKRDVDNKFFAMKIIKNKKAHHCQGLIELRILEHLNKQVDKGDLYHIIRKHDHFFYKNHLCIVFELLNENLFELLKQNYFQGLSLNSIRFIIKQILEAVYQLQKANLIHCDLKPENILLKIDKDNPKNEIIIKITDFGSACFKNNTMFQYIQSRYYRSPEVIIGIPYSIEIDMWSIGCIAAELYLGEPLLPGMCEYDQLSKIIFLIGDPPEYLINQGKNSKKYFIIDKDTKKIRLKTLEEFYTEYPNYERPKYSIPAGLICLEDLCKLKKTNLNNSNNNINNDLESFVNLLKGLLQTDPKQRWNAKSALRHPFITRDRFEGYFNPYQEEISFFPSVENSHMSDCMIHQNVMKNKSCQSMIMNYANASYYSNTSNSIDMSCYQPNIYNIPLKMLKKFPYAMIDDINLKPGNNNNKQNNNKTFMMTSFDNLGKSYLSGECFHKLKNRVLKDKNVINNKYNLFTVEEPYKRNSYKNKDPNKSLFYKDKRFKEYDGIGYNKNNTSFDHNLYNNRTRSYSDFNFTAPNKYSQKGSGNTIGNNLNYSNYSTHENQLIKSYKNSNMETPININKTIPKTDGIFYINYRKIRC